MLNTKKNRLSLIFIAMISFVFILLTFSTNAYPQPLRYHNFADQLTFFGIPHFVNVISNLPFFIVGVLGLYVILKNNCQILKGHRLTYIIFFTGVTLIGVGSSLYHLHPTNETLLWDRLPMTLAFISLFSFVIAEFIDQKFALKTRFPFLVLGVFSVFYWAWSESQNAGDLRLYFLVQFIPLLIIPIILWRFQSVFSHSRSYWYLLLAYALAKVFEIFDYPVYQFLGFISGHSLKHILAAFGIWVLLRGFQERRVL